MVDALIALHFDNVKINILGCTFALLFNRCSPLWRYLYLACKLGHDSSVSRPIIAQVSYHNMSTDDLAHHLLLFYASVSDFLFPILMVAGVVAFIFPWLAPVFFVESGGRYLNGQPAALTCIGARKGTYMYIGYMCVNWELNGS